MLEIITLGREKSDLNLRFIAKFREGMEVPVLTHFRRARLNLLSSLGPVSLDRYIELAVPPKLRLV
jgi:hypothetical protein